MAMIGAYYPPSPRNVPADLCEPSTEYKSRVVLVLFSLIFSFCLYVGLMLGSLALVIVPVILMFRHRGFVCLGIPIAVPSLLFFLFLVKGLSKRSEKERTVRVEITEEDQPLLFAFIERLCEETGAAMPRRVYVSHEVNAAVVTHTGITSLFWPTGKDLLIGLGLVNILNLSEFKSVLAHEFGHFAQKSTRLGGYVYTANRIIYDLVVGRDWFDDILDGMKRSHGGQGNVVTALGWTIYGLVWCLRKVLEGAFFLINLVHRSLSRQMEFNADLVAVSVAGSDAGIHALYRLTFCDGVWGQAINDLRAAADHKLYTADLFYHLNHAANFLRKLKQQPRLGEPPPLPEDARDTPDLFTPEDEGKPQMWATHPSNYDREQNAKAYYIRSTIDNRSAWVLFKEPQQLREEITYRYYRFYKVFKKDTPLDPPEEVQAFIDDEHAETTYDPCYHGLYDSRYLEIEDLDDVVDEAKRAAWDEGRLERVHLKLYDNELKEWMDGHNNRREEYRLLTGLVNGDLELKDDDLEFRGRHYDVREAKRLLKKVDRELEEDRRFFEGIDRRGFLVYYQMAMQADTELRKELFKRYDFHLTCQDLLRKLNVERNHMEATLNFLSGRKELQQNEFRSALKACRDAQKSLKKTLGTADDLPMPDLANMKKGKPLGHFLLDKKLVHSLDSDEDTLRGEWISKLMNQIGEVQEKLRRIHFKSLGAMLLLQDRIHRKWRDYLASLPAVLAATEEPARAPVVPAPMPAAPPAAAQVAARLASATTPVKPPAPPLK
jgi:Zn-dependent protease with chaperone function